ncbi:MAG: type II toxin-antitoxin system VapC family toxin [Sporichthyaceae bacterium]
MRLLLDTHVVLWQLSGSRELSLPAQRAIGMATALLFSAVSFAEIGVKASIGKLEVPHDLREQLLDRGVSLLALESDHGLAVGALPLHHRDPFDRLLIAQARSERLTICTSDRRFVDYDVPVIDAG